MNAPQSTSSRWLKSTDWLAGELGKDSVVVVDGSFYLPTQNRNAKAEYLAAHIPGAVFFDIDAIADHSTDLPHMLPGPAQFAKAAGALGIGDKDTIVVYDGLGLFSAPRVWWTFRLFGAKNVFILDGGLPAWTAEGRKTEAGDVKRSPRTFNAAMETGAVAMQSDVQMALNDRNTQVVDARPAGRFAGRDPEPRPGLRGGHMPGAKNVPALSLSRNGELLPLDELRAVLEGAGLDLSRPVITSCGSGVTAATISFALYSLGYGDHRLYDGSWTEWGGRPDTPIVTGKD